MKKLVCFIAAAAMMVCFSIPAFAASSNITVKNNSSSSKPVTYTYDPSYEGEIVKSIKKVMNRVNDITKNSSVVQTLTVTSDSANKKPVNVSLRLSVIGKAAPSVKAENEKAPTDDEYTALSYYNIKINSSDGELIYDYENAPEGDRSKAYKNIPLGTFNTSSASESRTYKITLSANKDITNSEIANIANKLDWCIVTDTNEIAEPTAAPTVKPQAEVTPEPSASPSATPEVSATPASTPASGEIKLEKGEYVAGKDIKAGRYNMTGEGKVSVYKPDGTIKTTVVLKKAGDTTSNGVTERIINIEDGERMAVETEADLSPYVAPSTSPSPTPKATAAPTSKPAATATPAAANKSNPKTGDSAPVAGVCTVGMLALIGAAALMLKNRKNH